MNINPVITDSIHTSRFPQETVSKEISEKIKFGSFFEVVVKTLSKNLLSLSLIVYKLF